MAGEYKFSYPNSSAPIRLPMSFLADSHSANELHRFQRRWYLVIRFNQPIDLKNNSPMNSRENRSRLAAVVCFVVLFPTATRINAEDLPSVVFPEKDWEQAKPQSQGIAPTKLQSAVDYLEANAPRDRVNELVIIRNGRLIHRGSEIDKMHGIWSSTKSFSSTVLGLLIHDAKCTLDTLAKDHVPEMSANYSEVSLRHFTTMTSGYRAVGDEPRGSYTHGPSKTPFQANPRPLFAPGTKYAYWDSAMNQFGHVLTGAIPKFDMAERPSLLRLEYEHPNERRKDS